MTLSFTNKCKIHKPLRMLQPTHAHCLLHTLSNATHMSPPDVMVPVDSINVVCAEYTGRHKPHSHCTLVPENCQKIAGVPSVWTQTRVADPGLVPGWDLVTLPGSVPERALCEQKPDQCRNECVVVMTHFIVRLFYRLFWRQINVHTTKNM